MKSPAHMLILILAAASALTFFPAAASYAAASFATGRPADIDAKKDYFRAGMDAGYAKDYARAAENLRYSYYQAQDSYRLFWYLQWLSNAGLHDAVIAEASAAPDGDLWHKAYQSGAVRFWAQALLEKGLRAEAADLLVKHYELHRDPKAAQMLVTHFWNSEKAGSVFLSHPRHGEIVKDIITRFASVRKDEYAGLAAELYNHLVSGAAESAMRSLKDPSARTTFTERFSALKQLAAVWDKEPKAVNAADWKAIEQAFTFFLENHPSRKNPHEFVWLNFYVPEVSATIIEKGKTVPLHAELSRAQIDRRIFDLKSQYDVMSVFYYYITRGEILMSARFEVLDAKVTRTDSASALQSIVTESVRPYPSRKIYEDYRAWDGLMWWFPHYGSSAYLGGAKSVTFVPEILRSPDLRMLAKMSTGASWRVLIHEVFHGFGTLCRVEAGHNFTTENRSKWPDWYRAAVAANAGNISELAWYEGVTSRRNNADRFAPVRQRDRNWLPDRSAFEKAQTLGRTLTAEKESAARELLAKADAAAAEKNAAKEIALLSQARTAAPEMAATLFKLGYSTQWRAKNKADAIPLFEEYLKLFGGFENTDSALIYLGGWYQTKNPAFALELIDRYGGNPLSSGTWTDITALRIKLLRQLGRGPEADALQKSFDADPRKISR